MTATILVLFVATGAVGGYLAGLLGVGGGVLFVPCLHFGFTRMGMSPDDAFLVAVATSLAVIVVTSLSSALGHAIHGALTGGQVLSMALLAVPSSLAGAVIGEAVGGDVLKRFFGFFLLLVAYRFLRPLPERGVDPDRIVPVPHLAVVGGLSGLLSSILGIGGGILTVTLLNLVLYVPMHRAVANSSGLIVFSSVAGTIGWILLGLDAEGLPLYSWGYVNLPAWSLLSIGAVIFAQAGAWTAARLDSARLRPPFAVLLVLVGVKMLLF